MQKDIADLSVDLDDTSGTVTIVARRDLDTGDAMEDFLIPLDTEFSIGFAFNSYANILSDYTPHDYEVQLSAVVLKSDGTYMFGDIPIDSAQSSLITRYYTFTAIITTSLFIISNF